MGCWGVLGQWAAPGTGVGFSAAVFGPLLVEPADLEPSPLFLSTGQAVRTSGDSVNRYQLLLSA